MNFAGVVAGGSRLCEALMKSDITHSGMSGSFSHGS